VQIFRLVHYVIKLSANFSDRISRPSSNTSGTLCECQPDGQSRAELRAVCTFVSKCQASAVLSAHNQLRPRPPGTKMPLDPSAAVRAAENQARLRSLAVVLSGLCPECRSAGLQLRPPLLLNCTTSKFCTHLHMPPFFSRPQGLFFCPPPRHLVPLPIE